jgi:hypothetical protein
MPYKGSLVNMRKILITTYSVALWNGTATTYLNFTGTSSLNKSNLASVNASKYKALI